MEENSGVYAGRGCRASTFHFRRQGGSFLFRMEEFVSRSPRAKPGKCKEKRGKMAANRGGKSRKNKSELRSLNIRWKLRFACTQTRKTDSVSSSPLISSQRREKRIECKTLFCSRNNRDLDDVQWSSRVRRENWSLLISFRGILDDGWFLTFVVNYFERLFLSCKFVNFQLSRFTF